MNAAQTTFLVTLTGRDRPGVTSRLFSALAGHPLTVLDIEQVVIRGRLVLGVLLHSSGSERLTWKVTTAASPGFASVPAETLQKLR